MPLLTYQQENMYKCDYCGIKESSLQSIIEHCKLSHGEETLKYRQLVLDENTGIQRYQIKNTRRSSTI